MADYLKKLRDEATGGSGATKVEDKRGQGYDYNYKPNKQDRAVRKNIWDRYQRMKDDPLRKEAERDWEQGDKKVRLWRPERDPDDWRADIRLPDSFAAVQTHLQETIGVKIRPSLKPTEGSDTPLAFWANGILTYNMDRTNYDLETIKCINCSATRGTAFSVEEYLYETRQVKNPVSVENGVLKYKQEEKVDKDDTFMMMWPNERIFVDEAADTIEKAEDMILEERMRFDTFQTKYGNDANCRNTDKVIPCGSISPTATFFERADEDPMDGDYVQVLRYYNKMTDSYQILANTVIIRNSPIPFKHKELPVAVWNYYPVEGRIYGMGLPKILEATQEEREAIRNLSIDRAKMQINKMFLVSDLFDIDEDEATTRPHGFIHVNAGGLPLSQIMQPLEYGDVPTSSIRMDDTLVTDEQRATGIDDRSQSVNVGGTATEAAILTEQSQKRINLINTMSGMATVTRIGMLKWGNIQFFYPAPRVISITDDDDDKTKKIYRNISTDGMDFDIEEDGEGGSQLKMNTITGTGNFKLDPTHAAFFDNLGDVDIMIQWDIKAVMPQAIRQSKAMELFNAMVGNPITVGEMNVPRAMKDVIMEYDYDPKTWMKDGGRTIDQQQSLANFENMVMLKGIALDPTEDADEQHTLVHLTFTESQFFKDYLAKNPQTAQGIQAIFTRHIMGENANGPGGGAAGGVTPPPDPSLGLNPVAPAAGTGAPLPTGPQNPAGNTAAPAQPPVVAGNPTGQQVSGGQVTNNTAPLR